MSVPALDAITDLETLRALVREQIEVIAQRDAAIAQRDRLIAHREAKIAALTQEIARLRRVQYAARSERLDPAQRTLFEEAIAADIAAVEDELAALQDAPVPAGHAPRRPARRRPLPPELPRIETVHAPERCACAACGQALVQIGEHVSEKLDCEPLKFFVRRDVYPQYACRRCETIVAEPVAPSVLDRGIAAPGLLAQVVVQKYTDHLPLYRQEAMFARSGIALGRTTLAEWCGVVGLRLEPLVEALRQRLRQAPVLHADETPVAQLDPGAGKTKRAYLFAYRTADDIPIVVFDYCPSRAGKHAQAFLGDWQGALMVDDYAGYKALFAHGITELGCWAHARRKFFDVHAASGSPLAAEALRRIAAIYHADAGGRGLATPARGAYRRRHLAPLLDEFRRWLEDLHPKVLGNSGLHKAIAYTRHRWPALTRLLGDGRYPIDNNPVENAIRPVALGRKNWLFAGSETAGKRAAAIMSLLATAKANGLDPHAWLTDVLTRLPTTLDRDLDTLLPLPQRNDVRQGAVG
ncbi:IS66 family transposase [Vulcaniibacterium gelatinicum]|uniref:IS66 family transposase n=1 Tax=Vulcaniibacterium gelatinicum TaxID=2598725 RepID=UPI0011C796D9|nr:IS66 family transposase [Vulcaniibacterium gelatinicum]